MTLPVDCSASPAPASSSSRRRDHSPASRFALVRTLVSELSRLPSPEGVGKFYALCEVVRKTFRETFLWFHRNWPDCPQKGPELSTEIPQIPTVERDWASGACPEMDEGPSRV
ncbi:hypothetical protein GCM10023350_19110 [Nocardioides endophyticus]|uniref:Uncharacterized protein n=1 Tax=Nocardioides endophyticus TaxID=1353775 RepID=A0ABP8YQS6_9ACTN